MEQSKQSKSDHLNEYLRYQEACRKERELDDAIDDLAESLKRVFNVFENRIKEAANGENDER